MRSISKYKRFSLIPLSIVGLLSIYAFSCTSKTTTLDPEDGTRAVSYKKPREGNFDQYWYQGKAEISSYTLTQARYGQLREGDAVLVFVTEPFSKSRQVKTNPSPTNKEDVVSVLKLNAIKKFVTGVYDYSILQSVFTPVDLQNQPHSIKVSTSLQEWCGHTYTQLNLQTYKYKVLLHSYFESEGDNEYQVEQALLEDELFNRIRINPKTLPTGKIQLIPSTTVARLLHQKLEVREAEAVQKPHASNNNWMTYELSYNDAPERRLTIHYQKDFPHQIEAWEEVYMDGSELLTTKATRRKTLMTDYWNQNKLQDESMRKTLGLD
jgi:hypothetical protein